MGHYGRDLIVQWFQESRTPPRTIGTGWPIDRICGTMEPQQLALLWARTSAGKTTILCNWVWNTPVPTVFVTLEMPPQVITEWLLTISGKLTVPARELREVLADRDDPRYQQTVAELREVRREFPPIWIVPARAPTVADLHDIVDRIEMEIDQHIDRVMIDHLGLMAHGRDYTGVATTASELRQFAEDTDRLVIAAQQTGRTAYNGTTYGRNDGHLPVSLSSGLFAGEHDADWIYGAWRPERNPDLGPESRAAVKGITRFSVVKNRRHGTIHLEGISLRYNPRTRQLTPTGEPE